MKTITFYSYKGGVGRTLALANIAKRLSEFGKKVCIIDFDLEAPGLHLKFKEYVKETDLSLGIVDYIQYFLNNNSIPEKFEDFITKISFPGKKSKQIKLIPAGKVQTPEYWKTLAGIDWVKLFYKKNSQGVALFADLKERIRKEIKPDYLLIDSRTGISEISGITMSILADEIVLLSVKNEENLNGLKQIIKSISLPENTLLGKSPKLTFVLCRIPYFDKPEEKIIEKRVLNEVDRDLKTFVTNNRLPFNFEKIFIIHSDPKLEIEEKLLMGYQYEKEIEKDLFLQKQKRANSQLPSDYLDLFEELTKDKLTGADKQKFNNIKKAEFLIESCRKINNTEKRKELLIEAIILHPELHEAYYLFAYEKYKEKKYQEALDDIERAISLYPESIDYQCRKGSILSVLGKVNESIKLFTKILIQNEKNFYALSELGAINYKAKKYEEALKYYEKIVEYYPDYYGGYNNIGNVYRLFEKYDIAFKNIYKALELSPKDYTSTGILSEIYAQLGNEDEFYRNFEQSLLFGMPEENVKNNIKTEKVYKKYLKEQKFINLLKKYNITI